ncbi:MAG TPA: NifB/NifX family molybdenum-iron cluster-binding protein [Geobacteraceae bacterium]
MTVRVAIATSNGRNVDEHFGRARSFRIYVLENGSFKLLEGRESVPPCGGSQHDDQAMERLVDMLADCSAVAAAMIGPGAIDALLDRGVLPIALETSVDEALATLQNSKFLRAH